MKEDPFYDLFNKAVKNDKKLDKRCKDLYKRVGGYHYLLENYNLNNKSHKFKDESGKKFIYYGHTNKTKGLFNGFGLRNMETYIEEGQFVNGQLRGKARRLYSYGSICEGLIHDNKWTNSKEICDAKGCFFKLRTHIPYGKDMKKYERQFQLNHRGDQIEHNIFYKILLLLIRYDPDGNKRYTFSLILDKQTIEVKEFANGAKSIIKGNTESFETVSYYKHGKVVEGTGNAYFEDGTKYEGHFKNGKYDGEGKNIWPDGSKYEGLFQDNQRHGEGVMTYKNGFTFAQKYNCGNLIAEEQIM